MLDQQFLEAVIAKLEWTLSTSKIRGVNFDPERAERFERLKYACGELYNSCKCEKYAEIWDPSPDTSWAQVFIDLESLEISSKNKDLFLRLMDLSDEVLILGGIKQEFRLVFIVDDIWTE